MSKSTVMTVAANPCWFVEARWQNPVDGVWHRMSTQFNKVIPTTLIGRAVPALVDPCDPRNHEIDLSFLDA